MSLIKTKKRVADHGEVTLFAHLGKHEIFKPVGTHPPMTVRELAAHAEDSV